MRPVHCVNRSETKELNLIGVEEMGVLVFWGFGRFAFGIAPAIKHKSSRFFSWKKNSGFFVKEQTLWALITTKSQKIEAR